MCHITGLPCTLPCLRPAIIWRKGHRQDSFSARLNYFDESNCDCERMQKEHTGKSKPLDFLLISSPSGKGSQGWAFPLRSSSIWTKNQRIRRHLWQGVFEATRSSSCWVVPPRFFPFPCTNCCRSYGCNQLVTNYSNTVARQV